MTAATPSSVYQQLRGRLAEVKLADASEALASVLHQAQAEGWSLTHALERLLAIEVTATDVLLIGPPGVGKTHIASGLGHAAATAGSAASALFRVINQRYLKTSIATTTNRPVGAWGRSSATPPLPPGCSTGSCTDPSSSPSAAAPTGSATTPPNPPCCVE